MDQVQNSTHRSQSWTPSAFLSSSSPSSAPPTTPTGSIMTMGSTSAGILRDALRWGNESLKIMSLQLGQSAGASTADSSNGQNLLDPSYESNGDDGDQQSLFPSNNNGNLLAALVNGSMLLNESENLLSSSDNQTYSEMEPSFPSYIRTTSTLLCGIILFIGIVGNILVPIVVWRNKELRSSTNIFLVNLSLADLLILLVCMPPVLIELHSKPEVWVLGATMCKLVPFAELSVAHASVLTILAISLERYIAICRPLRANYTCTKHRAAGLCIAIWIVGFIATSPMLAIAQHKKMRYVDKTLHNACLTQAHNFWSTFYFLASTTIFFFLPLIVLIGLYWVISKNLMSDPSGAGRCCPDHPSMRARRQVVIMLATVVFFFFICLLPFRIFTVYIILAPPSAVENMGEEVYYNILYMCRVMLYLNSSINPVLYNVMSSKFREAFFKVLGCPLGSQRRARWLCRHLSRSSTFTTSSTLPSSSIKSHHYHHGKTCCANGGSVRIREMGSTFEPKNGHFHGGGSKHPRALRAASGPYYPSAAAPKRQFSTDATTSSQTQALNPNKDKKVMIRANSVV